MKTAELYTFRLITPEPYKQMANTVNANRKSNMGFPTSYQPMSCVTPNNFPKTVFRWQNLSFLRRNVDKNITSMQQSFILSTCKNFQRYVCSAINYLSNGINILAGDDPVPVKFRPKGTTPKESIRVSLFTIEIYIKYNRPICLCVLHVARCAVRHSRPCWKHPAPAA